MNADVDQGDHCIRLDLPGQHTGPGGAYRLGLLGS